MKIACVAPSTIPSETANSVQVMKVCQALTQLGHSVTLFVSSGQPTDFANLKEFYGLSTSFELRWLKSSPSLRKIDFAWQTVRLAKKEHFDLVYTRLIWTALFALDRNLPVVLELHEIPGGRFSPWLYKCYVSSKRQKLTVFITRALQNLIEQKLEIKHNPTEVCIAPDGVDLERFEGLPDASTARKTLGLREATTALYSGGFYPGRGVDNLYELAKHFPEVQFIWVGGKPSQIANWQQKLDENNLKNVMLTGYIANQNLPLYQAAAEILLMPYKSKVAGNSGGDIAQVTSPMKLFEYLASGRAILTSDLPVLREVLNESNAVFYPPENTSMMLEQFSRLVQDSTLRSRLAEQASLTARRYSWQQRMHSILDQFSKNQMESLK